MEKRGLEELVKFYLSERTRLLSEIPLIESRKNEQYDHEISREHDSDKIRSLLAKRDREIEICTTSKTNKVADYSREIENLIPFLEISRDVLVSYLLRVLCTNTGQEWESAIIEKRSEEPLLEKDSIPGKKSFYQRVIRVKGNIQTAMVFPLYDLDTLRDEERISYATLQLLFKQENKDGTVDYKLHPMMDSPLKGAIYTLLDYYKTMDGTYNYPKELIGEYSELDWAKLNVNAPGASLYGISKAVTGCDMGNVMIYDTTRIDDNGVRVPYTMEITRNKEGDLSFSCNQFDDKYTGDNSINFLSFFVSKNLCTPAYQMSAALYNSLSEEVAENRKIFRSDEVGAEDNILEVVFHPKGSEVKGERFRSPTYEYIFHKGALRTNHVCLTPSGCFTEEFLKNIFTIVFDMANNDKAVILTKIADIVKAQEKADMTLKLGEKRD